MTETQTTPPHITTGDIERAIFPLHENMSQLSKLTDYDIETDANYNILLVRGLFPDIQKAKSILQGGVIA